MGERLEGLNEAEPSGSGGGGGAWRQAVRGAELGVDEAIVEALTRKKVGVAHTA
jgi:hypothetical protein